jgi:hypothetical protein
LKLSKKTQDQTSEIDLYDIFLQLNAITDDEPEMSLFMKALLQDHELIDPNKCLHHQKIKFEFLNQNPFLMMKEPCSIKITKGSLKIGYRKSSDGQSVPTMIMVVHSFEILRKIQFSDSDFDSNYDKMPFVDEYLKNSTKTEIGKSFKVYKS